MANGNGNGSKALLDRTLTAVAGGAAGVLITFVTAVSTHSEELATLTAKIDALEDKITSGMSDRYRGADALRDLQLRDQRIDANAQHIRELQALHRLDRSGN